MFQVSKEPGILVKGKYRAAVDVKVYMLTLRKGSSNDLKSNNLLASLLQMKLD